MLPLAASVLLWTAPPMVTEPMLFLDRTNESYKRRVENRPMPAASSVPTINST